MILKLNIAAAGFRRILTALLVAGVFFAVSELFAFRSEQIEVLSAGVMVGGTPEEPIEELIEIQHAPLRGISPVSKIAIIQGAAGENPELAPQAFSRQRSLGTKALDSNREIRVTVKYRVAPLGLPIDAAPEAFLPPIYGPNPTSFAFQIDPSSITAGVLQYQIIAEKLNEFGVVLSSSVYPSDFGATGASEWVDVGVLAGAGQVLTASGGRYTMLDGNPNDGEGMLEVPAGVLHSPSDVALNEIAMNNPLVPPLNGMPAPIAMYHLTSNPPLKGPVKVTVLYPDFVFPSGQDGILDGTSIPESSASLAVWDGFMWRNMGGVTDANANTLTVRMKAADFIGVFAMGAPALADSRPMQKIITPNGDGINDTADFFFSGNSLNAKVYIYDTSGHRVKSLSSPNNLAWDGRDDNGKMVESGAYIYQFESEGETISGVIGVAK